MSYEYLTHEFHIRNDNIHEWTNEILTFLTNMQDTIITSVIIKNDNTVVNSYTNLNCKITSVIDIIQNLDNKIIVAKCVDICPVT